MRRERSKEKSLIFALFLFYVVGWADICLASYVIFLRVMRPDQFQTLIVNDKKAGKEFVEWLKRMDKYMQLSPPAPAARI